ncbi:MAG: sigma-54 dependent transcriptional regulator [Kofleriaceae bacterium]
MRVLVVEDDPLICRIVVQQLAAMDVEAIADASILLERLADGTREWDVIVLDVGLPGIGGVEALRRIRESASFASVVMLTGDTTAETATTCMRAGAFHYLTKPYQAFALEVMVASAARYAALQRELAGVHATRDDSAGSTLVGTSLAIRQLRATISRLADRSVSILLQGESGTGKELVARALHERGARNKRKFVALNCGAIPVNLIDSELFGHTRGSFTGAITDRDGVFVEADGGTLLLDEVGDMPLDIQARLLRVLQEGEIRPVGSNTDRKIDVRLIAATHVDLAVAVAEQRFRQDLYYRLDVVKIDVPALRDRLDDLPLLVAHLLKKHAGVRSRGVTPEAMDLLGSHLWPGNVRELENALLHALALEQGDMIGIESLPRTIAPRARRATVGPDIDIDELPLREAKRRAGIALERRYLVRAMERSKGSISEAARSMGLDRTNFRRSLQRYGLLSETFK